MKTATARTVEGNWSELRGTGFFEYCTSSWTCVCVSVLYYMWIFCDSKWCFAMFTDACLYRRLCLWKQAVADIADAFLYQNN